MLVKELLDKQMEYPSIIIINEKIYESEYCCYYKMKYYKLHEELNLYDKYGERKVGYYHHYIFGENIIMLVNLEDDN